MPGVPFIRQQGKQIPFTAGARSSIELQRGMVLRELYLNLTGQLTVAGASNTAANTLPGDEWGVIQDIVVRLDGRDIIKRIDGPSLRWYDYYQYGVFPKKSSVITQAIGDGATTNPLFDSTLILPFWMPASVRPMDFALDTRLLSRLDIEVAWGTFTNINSAATGFTVAPVLNIWSSEVVNVQGNFARWNIFPIANTFAGAANAQQFKLPVGYMYRSFLIRSSVNNAISAIRFKAGALEWFNLPFTGVDTVIGHTRRGENIVTGLTANVSWRAGAPGDTSNQFAYIDMVSDGYNSESVDTYGLTEAYLEMDIAAASTVTVTPSQLVVPRTSQPSNAPSGASGVPSNAQGGSTGTAGM